MDVADIREGFLCPMCMKDLGSDNQLQDHFEKAHTSSEFERGVLDNLRGN
jgi:rabenosyn-5